jgi:6-phosphofructokinase 1
MAAAGGLAAGSAGDAPHIILFPEIVFDREAFLAKVRLTVEKRGFCVIVVSEGVKDGSGKFLAEAGTKDAFGHSQLGGVGPVVAQMTQQAFGFKFHWAVADYLQRSARHIASKVDVDQAYAVGRAAVELALQGKNAVMPIIVRKSSKPYRWAIGEAPLRAIANQEKKLPRNFISPDGFGITGRCRRYLLPLIGGEGYPPYHNGLPRYATLKGAKVRKRLHTPFVI